MISRREYLKLSLAAGVALALDPRRLLAAGDQALPMMTRAIPSSGQQIPVVGLGSSATFAQVARSEDVDALREVLRALVDNGGSVFDTAPSYGASEEVAGNLAAELGLTDRIFWATKVNVSRGPGAPADADEARAQIDASFEKLRKPVIDLIQVHNLGDLTTQLPILKEIKDSGRIRHLGVTTTSAPQYEELEAVMRREPLDFIGIDYAIDNRTMEDRILPLARERGIAVMVYLPFGRTRLWEKVRGKELPDWAGEFDAATWGQFFLKFVLSHPAVTVVTPATSRPHHMVDNLGAGRGRLPDAAMRQRMIEHIESL
ncbi:MAG: aldo/keto reductase [Xanthomonadales bacterium]|nr:aldo/keto reductase [Xanthomonadales bacterium]